MKRLLTGLTLLVFSFVLAVGAIASDGKVEAEAKTKQEETPKEIVWFQYDEGLKKAEAEGKHVFINFTTSWCGYCKMMDRTTFKDENVVNLFKDGFVAVKVDAESKKELNIDGYKISEKNLAAGEFGVRSYPTYWFLKPDGEKYGQIKGYQNADPFSEILFYMKEKLYDKLTFDEFMKAGGRKDYKG